jgi:mRNA interferase RelE/StbE
VSHRVEIRRSAEKELAGLDDVAQRRVAAALLQLGENPFPAGVKKLRGGDGFRIRVGDHRVLYTVTAATKTVHVTAIGHRREVYR